jgi:mRNA-degrading endonuclease YafQ of YafQ-DinJ toxin-antitoxin module
MWTIRETKQVQKTVPKLPVQVREKYELWKSIVRFGGPDALRPIPGFHDEALAGEWKGSRSSRLNERWRVIYCFVRGLMHVDVVRITPHDYRR